MTAKQVLLAAAERIAKVGWARGNYANWREGGGLRNPGSLPGQTVRPSEWMETDAVGAIRISCNGDHAVGDAARERLRKHVGAAQGGLGGWNDEQPNKEAVISALRGAAQ